MAFIGCVKWRHVGPGRAGRALHRPGLLGSVLAAVLLTLVVPSADGAYVAVGWGGAAITSPDGDAWTSTTSSIPISFFGVAPGTPWVAVGSSGGAYSSADGIAWVPQPTGTAQWLRAVASDGASWVAVGTGGAIVRSTDGETWATVTSPTTADLHGVATDGASWVAVGAGGTTITSTDGVTWAVGGNAGTALDGIAHGAGTWIGVGPDGAMRSSIDGGATWSAVDLGGVTAADLSGIAWAGGTGGASEAWLAVGAGGTVLRSVDGTTWSASGAGGGATLRAVAPACQGTWLAVGDNGLLLTSPDGVAWTQKTSGTTANLRGAGCMVSAPPLLSCDDATVAVGQPAALHAVGGTAPYSWTSQGAPGAGADPQYAPSFGAAGVFEVTLTDGGLPPYEPQQAQCSVTVTGGGGDVPDGGTPGQEGTGEAAGGSGPGAQPAPFTCAPATQTTAPGSPVSVQAVGGKPPFTVQAPGGQGAATAAADGADGEDAAGGGGSGTGFTAMFGEPGGFTVLLVDAAGNSAPCGVNVVRPFEVTAGGPYAGIPGHPVALAAIIHGGVSGFTCHWTSAEGHIGEPDQCAPSFVAERAGDVEVVVQVTDASGDTRTAQAVVRIREPAAPAAPAADCAACVTDGRLIHGQGDQARPADLCPIRGAQTLGVDAACAGLDALAAAPPPATDASVGAQPAPPESSGGVAAGIAALAAASLVALRFFLLREGLYIAIIVLFSRLKRGSLLDNPTRAFLVEQVADHPGTHFLELVRASGKGRGTIQHHLAVLVQAGILQTVDVAGLTGYRLAEASWDERLPASRALRAPQAKRFLEIVEQDYCVRIVDLAERCGMTYGGAMYHVRRMAQAGLVEVIEGNGTERKVRLPANGASAGETA